MKNPQDLRAVNRFERAVRAHDNAGAVHPDDHDAITQEFHAARLALIARFPGRGK